FVLPNTYRQALAPRPSYLSLCDSSFFVCYNIENKMIQRFIQKPKVKLLFALQKMRFIKNSNFQKRLANKTSNCFIFAAKCNVTWVNISVFSSSYFSF
ncbi:MAG: hypothetical protein NWQ55_00415, partial [Salibacteraceae bacterium]|nr:hypothetical protein [Salibacteraceae bacterium]